ncbi:MAG: SIMPL domain-containing protein [Patescibacteria group bacterium]
MFWPTWRENKLFTALLGLVGLGVVLLLGVKTMNGFKENAFIGKPEIRDMITIEGEGKVAGVPEIAVIGVGISTENKEVVKAQTENNTKMTTLIGRVKGFGVDSKDIQTTNYSLSPQYEWPDGKRVLRGYRVTQEVQVKIRDLGKIGAILSSVGESGANQVSGVSFTIDDPETLREQAREKALENARAKAKSVAEKAGVKLGKLVTFSEYSPSGSTYYKGFDSYAMGLGGATEAAAPAPVESGSLDIVVNVNVTYEIL